MDNNYRHITLQFDTAERPVFRENKGRGFVEFGADNQYPKYLLDLYNESPKHGAIIKSKCGYIYGKGFEVAGVANSKGESWNNILKRIVKDDELYRGFYLQIIWNRAKKVAEVYHIEFHKVRTNKELNCFYVKNDWKDPKEKAREYPAYDPNNPVGSQIYYYKEYNPYSEVYPVPGYFQALAYIESDILVSRHILGNAKQGFVGSKLINLNNGLPPAEEQKGEIERQLLKKFTGSEGKRMVIMFNPSKDNAAEIIDLGNTMLTKEDFTNINNLIQQEIFAGHQVVSPALMGIKTEGQLGGRTEIRDAYEIFNNTYVSERQQNMEEVLNKFRNMKGEAGVYKIVPVEPLKFEFSESIMAANLTQDEIRSLMGKEPLQAGQVTSDGKTAQSGQISPTIAPNEPTAVQNEAIKNLTGRQYQNVMRIVRHFSNGKISKEQASLMLKSGYGLSDADVNVFLGVDDDPNTDEEIQKFFDQDRLYNELSACGEKFSDYEVVRSYKVGSVPNAFADQPILNQLQANVLDMITKDKRVNAEGIAKAVDASVKEVQDVLDFFVKNDIVAVNTIKVGMDTVQEWDVKMTNSELEGKNPKTQSFYIRYTYEGPIDNRNRPFCARLVRMSGNKNNPDGKTWSMTDIQNMSFRLGYSVLDRRGGFWNDGGVIKDHCRHDWIANVVTKKK
jgi:hypothetical protein